MADEEYKVVGVVDLEDNRLELVMTHNGQGCKMKLPDGVDFWRISSGDLSLVTIGSEGVEMQVRCRSDDECSRIGMYLADALTAVEAPRPAQTIGGGCNDEQLQKAIKVFERMTGLAISYMDVTYHDYVSGENRHIKEVGLHLK